MLGLGASAYGGGAEILSRCRFTGLNMCIKKASSRYFITTKQTNKLLNRC